MSLHPTPHPIVNPNVYLNYLPPKVAEQFEVARDLYLVTLGACVWDMLVSLPEDIVLLRSGFRATLVAYFLSRFSALTFVVLSVIVKTRTLTNCNAVEYGVTTSWVLATAGSSFLFFRRVKAVYNENIYIYGFFFVLLLANIGVSVLTITGSRLKPLADTGYCVNAGVEHYVAAAPFSRLFFDSCVFIAISYRFATMRGISGETFTWRTLLSRKASSRLVRAMLQGGQQYYLMSLCSNIVVASLIVTPSVPPIYQAILIAPDLALTSSMACRVFRNLKITADTIDTAMSKVLFQQTGVLGGQTTIETGFRSQHQRNSSSGAIHVHPIPNAFPGSSAHSRTTSMPSLRRSQGEIERYSILKIKPVSTSSTTMSSKAASSNTYLPDSPV